MSTKQLDSVKEYYGEVLKTKNDLKTTACCTAESFPNYLKPLASQIHPEIVERFYGCGVPLPPALEGCTVLDLGCGTGRDAYLLSKLVGPNGNVIGVDMTENQLSVAKKHLNYHMDKFGFAKPNLRFVQGYIEDLASLDIADNSVDIVVSNCVINLSPAKERVFAEAFRVLKPGGELFFSDVFSDRRLPEWMRTDAVLLGECLGGALYTEDFRRLLAKVGCADFRVVRSSPIEMTNDEVKRKVGETKFGSITIRAFKLDVEDRCEDYGQVAYYNGGIEECPSNFLLDNHHFFEIGRPMLVCSNTAAMVSQTRYGKYFRVEGDTSHHFGLFDCGPTTSSVGSPAADASSSTANAAACC